MKIITDIKVKAVKGFIILFTLLLVTPSCDDRLDEINQNPNALTDISDEFLFAKLVRETFITANGKFMEDYGAQLAHQAVSNSWVKSIDQYMDTHAQGDIMEGMFNDIYKNIIKYVNEIVELNSVEGEKNNVRIAMARIMAIVGFEKLTDFFGDVPYFEAGMGKKEILYPKYDPQEEIYADMVEQLKLHIEVLKGADPADGYPDQDPMYDNDLSKWVRFANSFRLRLAMRARFADPAKYEPVIIECLGEPLIEENDQNAALQHQGDKNDSELYNPWYNKQRDYNAGEYQYNLSEMFVNWLKLTNDPRLYKLVKPNSNGEYIGMPNGLSDVAIGKYTRSMLAIPSEFMLAPDQPLWIMTASEIWLLRAEAALFNIGSGGDAAAFYQEGIKRAMTQWQISQEEIDTYLENVPEASLNGTQENQFRQIATQMWVAFVPNHQEAWSNIRRTGYPAIPQRTGPELSAGVTNGYLPKRVNYPYTVEKTLNGLNMQEAIERMGGDKIDTPVWWDVRD